MFKKNGIYRNRIGDVVKVVYAEGTLYDCIPIHKLSKAKYKDGTYNFWAKSGSKVDSFITFNDLQKNKNAQHDFDLIPGELSPEMYPEYYI